MLLDRWTETKGKLQLEDGLSVRGKADRVDLLSDGTLSVIDYKSGTLPSRKQIIHFDRQLLIEAVMLEAGAFGDIPPAQVSEVIHVALKRAFEVQSLSIAEDAELRTDRTRAELLRLLRAFLAREQGYTSRRAMEEMSYSGDYDHLARFGEWDIAEDPTRIHLP
jgi:RecB family exonuclease